jgi:hypothetical protein
MTLTPEEFNQLATSKDFNRLEVKVDMIAENTHQLLNTVDGLTKKVVDIEHVFVSNMAAHDRFEKRLARI